jgi:tetratricopeptide (TPR) repeat protein
LAAGEAEAATTRLERLRNHLVAMGAGDAQTVGLLAHLLSIDIEAMFPEVTALDAGQRREQTLQALVHYVRKSADRNPVLCAFEDLHWADPTTLELLGRLIDSIHDAPVLIIATTRPGFEADWADLAHSTVISLSRMGSEASVKLAQSVTPAMTVLPEDVLRTILARAEGNPLFIEELTRTVAQSVGPLTPNFDIPATLQDSLMARLDALIAGKAVAQSGAVVGREFSHQLIESIWNGSPADLDTGLSELEEAGLLYHRGDGVAARYQFKHALIQDAAYASLLRESRRDLHARVAASLEATGPADDIVAPELVAQHWHRAAAFERAVPLFKAAGEHAVARAAFREAIDDYRQGVDCAAELAGSPANAASRVELELALAECLRTTEQVDEAFAALERARQVAQQYAMHSALARLHHMLGNLHFPRGEGDQCLAHHQKSLQYARLAGIAQDEALALGGLGDAYYLLGALPTASRYFMECVSIARREEWVAIELAHLPNLVLNDVFFMKLDDSLEKVKRALDLASEISSPRAELLAEWVAAIVYLEKCDLANSLEAAQKALALARKIGALRFVAGGLETLGNIAQAQGDIETARERLLEALSVAEQTSISFNGPCILGRLQTVTCSAGVRAQYHARGLELLSHNRRGRNYLEFYRSSIEAALKYEQWPEIEPYCTALTEYSKDEPLRWAEFYAARGRALAGFGAGDRSTEIMARLRQLRADAQGAGMRLALRDIEYALAL